MVYAYTRDLRAWLNDLPAEFHPNKCKVIHITNKRKPIRLPYNTTSFWMHTRQTTFITYNLWQQCLLRLGDYRRTTSVTNLSQQQKLPTHMITLSGLSPLLSD